MEATLMPSMNDSTAGADNADIPSIDPNPYR